MNLTVLGMWHLGCVTAACCAKHFRVVGLDFDEKLVTTLNESIAPLFEPGLNELIAEGISAKTLSFTTNAAAACENADLLWVCYDTPVDENDESDVMFVLKNLRRTLQYLAAGTLVLISSQLPVGTCRMLEAEYPQFSFASSPENLRLGKAIGAFQKADRIIVGIRNDAIQPLLEKLFLPFDSNVVWMRTESAEMVKHALNSFLALSITFINEVARLCENVAADAKEVSVGLKSDTRVGQKAYLNPGGAFAGGTLARDVVTLAELGKAQSEALSLIPAIKLSNDRHRDWAFTRLKARLDDLRGKTIAILGLTYKPDTDTLRRSEAIELIKILKDAGSLVRAFDPAVKALPPELRAVALSANIAETTRGVDAAVICTEWPELHAVNWAEVTVAMRQRVFIDANRFLEKELKVLPDVEHLSVGLSA